MQATQAKIFTADVLFAEPSPAELLPVCSYAQPFATWCEQQRGKLADPPTDVAVNLALLDLQTKFFGWYASGPAACRRHFGLRKPQVRCLFEIYREQYEALHALELSLTPPRLREPAPTAALAPAPRVVQIEGVTLGDIVEYGSR